jgi:hypothetical protein
MGSSSTRFRDHTQPCATVGRTPLAEWSARCRDLYLTTHTTDKHPRPGGIRTHYISRRVAVDLRIRPRGHWDRHICVWSFVFTHTMGMLRAEIKVIRRRAYDIHVRASISKFLSVGIRQLSNALQWIHVEYIKFKNQYTTFYFTSHVTKTPIIK